MSDSSLHIMISAAVGSDDWVSVSTTFDWELLDQSEELHALRAGAVRFTALRRREGEGWSSAVRVPLSPEVFNGDFTIVRTPPELIEHLPGRGNVMFSGHVFFRKFELAQPSATGSEREATRRMREAHDQLVAAGEITPGMTDTEKHRRVLVALGIHDDKPPRGWCPKARSTLLTKCALRHASMPTTHGGSFSNASLRPNRLIFFRKAIFPSTPSPTR